MERGGGGWAAELSAVHALGVDGVVGAALAVGEDGSVWAACLGDGGLLGELFGDFVCVVFVDAGGEEEVLPALDVGCVVVVLARVGGFVFEDLDEFVEAGGDDGAEDGAKPVDPVVVVEAVVDDCWAEGARGVEGAAGEVYSSQLGDEEGKSDTCDVTSVTVGASRQGYLPTGAMKVPLCFSAASMKMVNTS